MADKLRCAVIGTGGAGQEHLRSLGQCHRAALVAIAEPNVQRAREVAARHHLARSYADYRELLEQPDLDAVTIAVPTHLHAAIALEALKARKHVYLEWPMGLNAKEAAKVVEAARAMKRTFMVAHPWRFHRHVQAARTIIERGDAGEVYHARGFHLKRSGIPRIGSWHTQKALAGGGCLTDLGAPLLDAALHLLREYEVTTVSAQVHARFGPRHLGEADGGRPEVRPEVDPRHPFDVEDAASALVRLKSGRSIVLEIAWACFQLPDAREHGLDLLGTGAGLSLFPLRHLRPGLDGTDLVHHFNGGRGPGANHGIADDGLHHFAACILDQRKPIAPVDESLKLRRILDALYTSAAAGKEVALKALNE